MLELAACTVLESLEIWVPINMRAKSIGDERITDDVVGGPLQHLPHLAVLKLRLPDQKFTPLLTVGTLVAAVVHSPLLIRADLAIDARVPPASTPIPETHRSQKPRILTFSNAVNGRDDAPIDDPKYVTDVLTQLYPEVGIRMKKGLEG
ncbi:hypothetical protein FRB93_007529 [Tulasnella sp. JGI-2019a]|nr:hypothetical protein FRB93_007529 [Tulasnella sp. JGI-2019a]